MTAEAQRSPQWWVWRAYQRHPFKVAGLVAVVCSALFVAGPGPSSSVAMAAVAVTAAVSLLGAVRVRNLRGSGWRAASIGACWSGIGYAAVAAADLAGVPGTQEWGLPVMVLSYLFYGFALLRFLRTAKGSATPWFDTATIVYAVGVLAWLHLLGPQLAQTDTAADAGVAFAYLVADLSLVALLVRNAGNVLRTPALRTVAFIVASVVAADGAYMAVAAHSAYTVAHPVDALLVVPLAALGALGWTSGADQLGVQPANSDGGARRSGWSARAPLFAVATVPVAAAVETLRGASVDYGVLVLALAGAFLLMFVRGSTMVSELGRSREQLLYDATHCPLTGLANRRRFLELVGTAVATGEGCTVLYVDLDDFKAVNDTCGHHTGDEVLVETSRRLQAAAAADGLVARLAGDEFAVLLSGTTTPTAALEVAEGVGVALIEPLNVGGRSIELGASVGVAHLEPGAALPGGTTAAQVEALVRRADVAMYQAKRSGKGKVCLYVEDDPRLDIDRLALRAEVRRAIGAGEFHVVYQPLVDLATGEVTGAEALVRWQHPVRGPLSPADFLEAAEATGAIVEIGEQVLLQAAAQWVAWHRQGVEVDLHLNVSVAQLETPGFPSRFSQIFEGMVPLDRVVVEVDETSLQQDRNAATAGLAHLRSLGVRVAVDDFGAGSSSLTYLLHCPVDVVKLDRSLVENVIGQGGALVEGILLLAASIGATVVAEGVETDEQAETLTRFGCPNGQGYLFGRPMGADELAALVQPAAPPIPSRPRRRRRSDAETASDRHDKGASQCAAASSNHSD